MEIFGFQKGKIEIKPEKFNFARGETVAGTLELRLKKPTHALGLSIAIIGERSDYDASRRQTTHSRAFEFTQPLDGEKEYAAGPLTYQFQITVPRDVSPAVSEGTLGTFLKTAQMLSGGSGPIRWYLVGRLAVAGFDLTKKVQINVA